MTLWTLGFGLYLLTTMVAVTLTHLEQRQREDLTPAAMLIGYGLCAVWPVVAAFLVILHRFDMPLGRPD